MPDRVQEPTAREYRESLELAGSVQELVGAGRDGDARELILDGTRRLLRGAVSFWTVLDAGQKTSSDPSRTGILGLEDWQLAIWEKPFFDEGEYVENPMWEGLQAERGRLRTRRRADVVSAETWYRHPHYELARAFGLHDEIVTMVPLGGGRECMLAVSRRCDDPHFTERHRRLLHALQGALRSSYRELAEPLENAAGRLRLGGLHLRLSPRFRPVLDQLLTGRSEKEIALALGLGQRTVHKYVEVVFRAAGVSSRAELMALFIPRDRR